MCDYNVLVFDSSYDCWLAKSILNIYRMSVKGIPFIKFREILIEDFELDFAIIECDENSYYKYHRNPNCLIF